MRESPSLHSDRSDLPTVVLRGRWSHDCLPFRDVCLYLVCAHAKGEDLKATGDCKAERCNDQWMLQSCLSMHQKHHARQRKVVLSTAGSSPHTTIAKPFEQSLSRSGACEAQSPRPRYLSSPWPLSTLRMLPCEATLNIGHQTNMDRMHGLEGSNLAADCTYHRQITATDINRAVPP